MQTMNDSVYEALLNSHALIEFSVDGQILWANQNFLDLMGYQLDELVDRPHSLFLSENELHENNYLEMWSQLLAGHIQTGEFKLLTKEKKEIWVHGSYNPVKDQHGNICKILKMLIDITEKKQLTENLERKNRELQITATTSRAATQAKSSFLANMSHEIRTPLNSIIGITDTLAETSLDKQQSSFVEILQKANHQLMTIINDILDSTKVESGEIQLHALPFELRSVVDDVLLAFEFRAKEKGLSLSVSIEPDLNGSFVGDGNRLRQILLNLLGNSIKFTNQGSVSLRVIKNTTTRPGNLLFQVADSGIGIPKHLHKDIFCAFTQGDTATNRRYGGVGLGLSISKKMVEMMDGHLWLDSEPDHGSVFSFTVSMPTTTNSLPSFHNPMQGRFQLSDVSYTFADGHRKILVVDDVEDNRKLLGIYLQKTQHEVHYAESGLEALRLVEKTNFDIIFMDVQMPHMDGHETTRLIRELERVQHREPTKILACTANAFNEDIQKSLQAGCDMHLSKPIRKDTVLSAINSYLPTLETVS